MLTPMMANLNGEQLAGIVSNVRAIAAEFDAIDREFPE